MKTIKLKKIILAAGVALAGLALTPSSHAQVTVNIEGGSASSTVLFDRATNLFAGGGFSVNGSIKGNVAQFVGTSLNPNLNGYGTITLNINLNNGAINGLSALVNQTAGAGDTNYAGAPIIPTFVDSATSPEAVGIDSTAANITEFPAHLCGAVGVCQKHQLPGRLCHHQPDPTTGCHFGNLDQQGVFLRQHRHQLRLFCRPQPQCCRPHGN